MSKYSIGIDFGSLSVRTVLVDVNNGTEIATSVFEYPHAIMSEKLPNGKQLPADWCLQHPQDYLDGLEYTVKTAVVSSGIDANQIIGIGIDFTANTYLPVDESYLPLCFSTEWCDEPHAWVKLWKHHGNVSYAEKMEEKAKERGEQFLKYYGGIVSPVWMLPRLYETLEEAPDLYEEAYKFMEAGDWIVTLLTGKENRSLSFASIKAFWSAEYGYPSQDFFASLDSRFEKVAVDKLSKDVSPLGKSAGTLCSEWANKLGLPDNITVAVANIDAPSAFPSSGMVNEGTLLMIIGTSSVQIVLGNNFVDVPNNGTVTEGGIIPGLFGYESGQNSVGDCLEWFVQNCVPEEYKLAAQKKGINIHEYLTMLAEKLTPGESGLLALDWWNGNRAVLCDYDLTGMIVGLNLRTKPEEIYRCLIEATAYGARKVIESFEVHGLPANNVVACGGISKKNPMFMQIYADVLNKKIHIAKSSQNSALGSAIFGATAAGSIAGGYDTVEEAAKAMGGTADKVYVPIPENVEIYNELYEEYTRLHDYFGRGENNVMKHLRKYRN